MKASTPNLRSGFTLIEAAVAIAAVGILSGILTPIIVKNLNDSKIARAKNDLQAIAGAITSQLKDTTIRPSNNVNGNFGTGEGDSYFFSTQNGVICTDLQRGWPYIGDTENNPWQTFLMLFGGLDTSLLTPWPNPSQLFYGEATSTMSTNEFAWKGPYMGIDQCQKTDPWGGRYYILGYNQNGQANNSPIWVISAGPNHRIETAVNPVATSVGLPAKWTFTGLSSDDLALRVQ